MRSLFYILLFTVLVLSLPPQSNAFLDPITLGIGAGSIGLGAIGYDFLKEQTYCRMTECCNERSIPGDINGLKEKLKSKLFGQHIVIEQLIPALEAHFKSSRKSRKPLVISFHGTPGTGKNYVADMIAESLYAEGLKSKYVHKYLGRTDFSTADLVPVYNLEIKKRVQESIASCPRSLFIFDEVDKMPEGIFESLASLVDYNRFLNGHDNTKAIFIFLSNTAGVQISDRLGEIIKSGHLREEAQLSHFEKVLEKAAYNLEGGLKKTSLIEAHVIDHYIPFLPLEKSHVQKCLEEEFWQWNSNPDRHKNAIDSIMKNDITYDRTHGLFATSGCKTLHKKVAVVVHKEKAARGH